MLRDGDDRLETIRGDSTTTMMGEVSRWAMMIRERDKIINSTGKNFFIFGVILNSFTVIRFSIHF